MTILRCKMCGGELDASVGTKIVQCEYCGTKQTVPGIGNEKRTTLFNRANRLRMNCEFDKANDIYENIIDEFPDEAEAYWGICLCNYGIEYVDDPATAKKIPTCHRASFEKLQNDDNFSLVLKYADDESKQMYLDEAREIDRIMGEILAVSKNEKPYDVFICYKETDENGERTVDSVLAYDIYDALVAKGLNVFFSRVTLEDKLGRQYEPYIFAALNSAKVMICIGTKYEYFNAVWVKNEWSRFLKLIAKDKTKVLVPCYKDMDAYDMPSAFQTFQAQDLSKLGATQDIVRGVLKIVRDSDEVKTPTDTPSSSAPCIIYNVSTIGAQYDDELWPNGTHSSVISYNKFNYIRFIVSVSKDKLAKFLQINARYKIFNENGNMIFDEIKNIAWSPNYDRFSLGWCIKGSDGSTVREGNYRAEFTVNDSLPYTCTYTITSAESAATKPVATEQRPKPAPAAEKSKEKLAAVDKSGRKELLERERRRSLNICQYCGGSFKGLFTKKCSICAKPKDY